MPKSLRYPDSLSTGRPLTSELESPAQCSNLKQAHLQSQDAIFRQANAAMAGERADLRHKQDSDAPGIVLIFFFFFFKVVV